MKTLSMRNIISLLTVVLLLLACTSKEWDNHYGTDVKSVDVKMWEALQDSSKYSLFVNAIKEAGLDSVLKKNQGMTLFVPTNEAFSDFFEIGEELYNTMAYHISQTILISRNIGTGKKLQMLSEKFSLLENTSKGILFDGIKAKNNSTLFVDGTFYELERIAKPKPNLYEYLKNTSPVMSNYIDERYVRILNKAESKPLGFNEDNLTVYDSVYTEVNYFELEYFSQTDFERINVETFEDFKKVVANDPNILTFIREPIFSIFSEYRERASTFVVFSQEQYLEALDDVADKLGPKFVDYRDIPQDWQQEVLIPYYFDHGMFDNVLTYNDFIRGTLKNVKSDSVKVDFKSIDAASRFQCSNGVVYGYKDLIIPDELYNDTIFVEGESLVYDRGNGQYLYDEEKGVVVSDRNITPSVSAKAEASGGQMLLIPFNASYKDQFTITFKVPKVFPRSYKLRYRATASPSAFFEIYVNGVKEGELDTGLRTGRSRFTGRLTDEFGIDHVIRNGMNQMDWRLDVEAYGDLEVTIVYIDGGQNSGAGKDGIVIDYVALIPYVE